MMPGNRRYFFLNSETVLIPTDKSRYEKRHCCVFCPDY